MEAMKVVRAEIRFVVNERADNSYKQVDMRFLKWAQSGHKYIGSGY